MVKNETPYLASIEAVVKAAAEPVTSQEVATRLSIMRKTARKYLGMLEAQGKVVKMQKGLISLWLIPGRRYTCAGAKA